VITPHEVLALATGVLLGLAFHKPEACRRACCVPKRVPPGPPNPPPPPPGRRYA